MPSREANVTREILPGLGKASANASIIGSEFIKSATGITGSQGLTNVGRALQKHAGREGSAFESITFSHKTANEQGLNVLNNIIKSESKIIEKAPQGGWHIFDKTTGQGFAISRSGQFNGFRELEKLKK